MLLKNHTYYQLVANILNSDLNFFVNSISFIDNGENIDGIYF